MHRIRPLHRFLIGSLFLFLTILPITMLSAQNLIPCSGPDCDLCSFVQLGQNIINFLVYFSTLLATVLFCYAGFKMLTGADNPGAITKAKKLFWTVLWGFALLLAAWLILDTAMRLLFEDSELRATEFGRPWNEILCQFQNGAPAQNVFVTLTATPNPIAVPGGNITLTWTSFGAIACAAGGGWAGTKALNGSEVVAITTTTAFALSCVNADGDSATVTVSVVVGTGPGPGSCSITEDGPCGTIALADMFGPIASQASQICSAESAGDPASESKTDILIASGLPFSIGLFQINMTQHNLTGPACRALNGGNPLNCISAFSGKNYTATIVDMPLYEQCRAALKNPDCNAETAAGIVTTDGGSWRQWSTAKKCKLP